ncbi:hypothetical protein PIB30_014011 [Stylosanthes scabra]|uniref:Uncharacterized protein n=1 Tax=Stylosanthes scabra TaxID=79078 RepID=A0ABU6Y4T0_9FABA|nr:hypothetical protein [Stylosanthes scabra]
MAPTRSTGIFLCLLIIILDVAAGILGIEAEIAQNKVQHLKLWIFECRDPSQKAFQMGLAAAILLGIAHCLVGLMGGWSCFCSNNRASSNKQISMLCLVLAWIALAVGMILLVIGTKSNHGSNGSCGFSHHHFLSIGGILCFVHGLFSVLFYGSATATIS